jgi:hypothetical protein
MLKGGSPSKRSRYQTGFVRGVQKVATLKEARTIQPDTFSVGELNDLIHRMKHSDSLANECGHFLVIETWHHRSASFYRCRPNAAQGPEIIVKSDSAWTDNSAKAIHERMCRLSRVLLEQGVVTVRVPRVMGWLQDPPLLLMEYVPGNNLNKLIRTSRRPHQPDARWLRQIITACGQALGAYHAHMPGETSDPTLWARSSAPMDDLGRTARRLMISRQVLARLGDVAVAESYVDFALYNVVASPDGRFYLLDPPAQTVTAPVHKDIAKFITELKSSLEASTSERVGQPHIYLDDLREAFYEGYAATGPVDIRTPENLWIVALYEAHRAMAKARKGFRMRKYRRAADYARSAGRLRRSLRPIPDRTRT